MDTVEPIRRVITLRNGHLRMTVNEQVVWEGNDPGYSLAELRSIAIRAYQGKSIEIQEVRDDLTKWVIA